MQTQQPRIPASRAFWWSIASVVSIHVLGVVALMMGRARRLAEIEPGLQHFNIFHVVFDRLAPWGIGLSAIALVVAISCMRADRLGVGCLRSLAGAGRKEIWLIALAVVLLSWIGTSVAYLGFPLSMDEYGADLQARIFSSGSMTAEIPTQWLPYAEAATPIFVNQLDGTHWISYYLPIYALMRAAFLAVRLDWLLNPLLIGMSVVLVAAIARRLLPETKEAPLLAALFLATSSQLLINGMSFYSMPAHLAFNLLWLWLYLQDTKRGWIGVAVVGVLAMGLHQFVMHPLFAGPFLLRLVLRRRWLLSGSLAVTYLGALIGWIAWTRAARSDLSAGDVTSSWGFPMGGQNFDQLINMVQVVTWQAPAVAVLALAGLFAVRNARVEFQDLVLSCLCTVALYIFFLKPQGHGWGYRYFFPVLGNMILLAVLGWSWLKVHVNRERLGAFVGMSLLCAVLLQLPNRMIQVRRFITPFAQAHEFISSQEADAVAIDAFASWYGQDLVRTDPLFATGPIVLNSLELTVEESVALRRDHSVVLISSQQLMRFGLPSTALNPAQLRWKHDISDDWLPRR